MSKKKPKHVTPEENDPQVRPQKSEPESLPPFKPTIERPELDDPKRTREGELPTINPEWDYKIEE